MSSSGSSPVRFCSQCDELISALRLQAKPNTHLCISCQSAAESAVKLASVQRSSFLHIDQDDTDAVPHFIQFLVERGALVTRGLASADAVIG